MKKIKQGIFILFFFGLMLCIAAAPTLVTNYYNNRLLDTVTLRELQEKSTDSMGLREKLEVVRRAMEAGTFYKDNFILDAYGWDSNASMGKLLETELAKLLDGMALEIKGFQKVYGEKFIYLDRDKSDTPVEIWHISGVTPEYYVSVYMDAETGMICQIMLESRGRVTFSKQSPDHLYRAAQEYMKLDEEENEEGSRLEIGIDYGSHELRARIYGLNEEDGTATDYDFEWIENGMGSVTDRSRHIVNIARNMVVYDW